SRVFSALLEPEYLKQRHALFSAIGALSAAELRELMARIDQLPPRYRKGVIGAVIDRWFELDPDAAAAWTRAHPRETAAWKVWARRFPKAVIEELHRTLSYRHENVDILAEAIRELAGRNLENQIRALIALPADEVRDHLISELFSQWNSTDLDTAVSLVQSLAPDVIPREVRQEVFFNWTYRSPENVKALLPELQESQVGLFIAAIAAQAMAEKGIDAALKWAAALPAQFRETSLQAVAGQWAKTEPVAALTWYRENGMDAARVNVASSGGIGENAVIDHAMNADAARTLQWIDSLPADSSRDALLERALRASSPIVDGAFSKPTADSLVQWMSQLPPDSQERLAFHLGVKSAATGSLESTRLWSDRFPQGPVRAAAIEAAAREHYRITSSPETEAKILDLFPETSDREAALSGIIWGQIRSFPERAAENAIAIGNPMLRRVLLDDFLPWWLESDPEKARAWLNQTPAIPPAWKAEWLKESNLRPFRDELLHR
ncbi:MAG: hypothetical protein V4710_09920, partial [Verrucomicrobiota bacterium]